MYFLFDDGEQCRLVVQMNKFPRRISWYPVEIWNYAWLQLKAEKYAKWYQTVDKDIGYKKLPVSVRMELPYKVI